MSFQSRPISCSDAMKLNFLAYWLIAFLSMIVPCHARADLVVVTGPETGVFTLSKEEVVNIYLGRYRRLSNGLSAEPLDMGEASETKKEFYWKLVEKTPAEINAYWARLVFSGQTRPPTTVKSNDEVAARLMSRPGVLAYVERDNLDKRFVILYEFER